MSLKKFKGKKKRTHRRVVKFDSSRPPSGNSRTAMSRTNSTLEGAGGLRIPRSNRLSWLYHRDNANTADDDSSPDDDSGNNRGGGGASDPSRFMLWLRDRSQVSQSLPPYLIAPMRG